MIPESLYQQALTLRQELLGVGAASLQEIRHPDVALSLNNLALLYNSQGRYAEAEPLYQQALAILMSTVGENHPHPQTVMSSLLMLKLQVMTGLDAKELQQKISNNPDDIIKLLQRNNPDNE